jgi:surface polysaccharide O-acyltransferase-like enzyme
VILLAGASAHDLVSTFTGGYGKPTLFSIFVAYIPYYLCGCVLYRTMVSARWTKYWAIGAFAAWLGIAIGTGLSFRRVTFYFYNWHDPLAILMSVGVFLVVCSLFRRPANEAGGKWSLIRYLDNVSLGVYLAHPLFIFILKELGHYSEHIVQWPVVSIPAMSVVILLASALLTSFLKAIPVVRRVV